MCEPRGLRRDLLPSQAQPVEIGPEGVGQFGARAGAVDILDPQQEPTALARQIPRGDRRKGMAEMKRPVGTGGEARDRHGGTLYADAEGRHRNEDGTSLWIGCP
jgi:hypothetical protein